MSLLQTLKDNGLAVAMFTIFSVSLIGMSIAGWASINEDLAEHGQHGQSYGKYLVSGDFVEGVFENWESEFLQMWALIILTVFLKQKGSADSKPMRGKSPQDTRSRFSFTNADTWQKKRRAAAHQLYSHSLGLAMLALFVFSFSLHAAGGAAAYNQDNELHGEAKVSVSAYATSSRFWYESLQNWQSEFLAVGTLLLLSIKLRERGSPQSKPIGTAYDHMTG
jgi:hypothetical protein